MCVLIETGLRGRHYATSREVAGSVPNEVVRFFNYPNPSSRTLAPGSTQPLTEMATRNHPVSKGKPERKADNLTATCELISRKCGSLDVSQTYGSPRPVTGQLYLLTLYFIET
jgi:hypothetical protein